MSAARRMNAGRWAGAMLLLVLAGVTSARTAHGEEPVGLTFNGFATLGLARASNSDYGVATSYAATSPLFDNWSSALDSVVGVQGSLRLTGDDLAVVQGVARADEEWSPRLTLGFWRHQVTPNVAFRLGRIASPLFRNSDIINVGYANMMVRSPLPLYMKINAMSSLDGGDISWQGTAGDTPLALQAYYGDIGYTHRLHPDDIGDIDAVGEGLRGLALLARSRNLALRVSYSEIPEFTLRSRQIAAFNSGLDQMVGALQAAGYTDQADLLAAYHNPQDSHPQYISVAFDVPWRQWRFVGEWTRFSSQSGNVELGDAWQLTVGRTVGQFSPYVFTSIQRSRLRALDEAAFVSTGISQIDAGVAMLKAGLDDLRQTADLSMRSAGMGFRYELTDNMALKMQYEHLTSDYTMVVASGISGTANPPSINLMSLVLDIAF